MRSFGHIACAAGLALAVLAVPAHAVPIADAADGRSATTRPDLDRTILKATLEHAARLPRLHALIAAQDNGIIAERVFRGPPLDRAVNIKSASKAIMSALVGAAIDRGLIASVHAPIVPLLAKRAPATLDPRTGAITVEHLLTMRAGLERTSGRENYGAWVNSPNWVRFALSRPFVDTPGGAMLYSTGNTHLLSAILTDVSGKSTLDLAREWIGTPLEISFPAWTRDPQGIYLGGNEMALSPRALLRFGEMYRNGGRAEGKRVLPADWIRDSWTARTVARSGDQYGYGWFIAEAHGHAIYYAWGFGGQMLYVIPSLGLTIVMTSDSATRSAEDGYRAALHRLVSDGFIPAAMGHARPPSDWPGIIPAMVREVELTP